MTEAPLNHPGDQALRALSLGQLTETELVHVSAHLGDCPACCRRIDQLATDDRLLARLQEGAASWDKVLVSRGQRRLAVRALRQPSDHELPRADSSGHSAVHNPQSAIPTQVGNYNLLADMAGNPVEPEELARRCFGVGLPAGFGKPTAPRSSLGDMRPMLLRKAKGESDPVALLSSDAMPQKIELGDRYQLFGEIARGGMGAVLRGRDRDLGRNLAVKVLLERYANLPDVARRFVEEAQIGGQLQHPGVVPVYDIGKFGDRPFFTMKLVEGMTLAAILSERKSPTDDRPRLLNIALQVAQALAYAHAKGVIHRDLKPANIMVGAFGEVQVMDWGLAKVLDEGEVPNEEWAGRQLPAKEETMIRTVRSSGSTGHFGTETEPGWILGTPAYMPPEQANGEADRLDRRADVFGLGAILCELLTGQPPYVGRSSEAVQSKAVSGDLTDAYARLDGCEADRALIDLAKRCLSPAAIDRPSDAQAVADGLSQYLNGVQERLQATERERAVALVRAGEERKRRKVQLALAAAVVILLVGVGAFAFWRSEQAQVGRERDARNAEAVEALLGQCEESLLANDAAKAAVALEAAKKRAAEGGAQEQAERLGRLDADLALVRELDAVDQFRWTMVENKFPDSAEVATRTREALRRFGADPDAVSVEEAAARVAASVARARVVAALDRLLRQEKSTVVSTLLRRMDADPFRDAVRDAIVAKDGTKFVELVGRSAALEQPPGFVAFLGEYEAIPLERRRQLLRMAVTQRPGDLGLLMTLGNTYLNNQKVANERRWWFQAAVAAAPGNASAHNSLGVTLKDKGEVDEAIACFRKAIDLDPTFADAHSNLGAILCNVKRDHEEAIACFQKAIALNPKFAWAYLNLGNARRGKGQIDEAIACFQKALDLDPMFAGAYLNLGAALAAEGQVNEAIACLQKAIDIDPQFAYAHNGLGSVLYDKGQVDEAIACFRKAIDLDPKYAGAYLNLGTALKDKGQVDEAIACSQKALDLDPQSAQAHQGLGAILCDVKREYDGAIACFQKAIDLDPQFAKAHSDLGVARHAKGQVGEAIACFQKAIALDPKLANAHNGLGAALAGKGQVDETIACFKNAIAINPKFAQPRLQLAKAEQLAAIRDKLAGFQNGTYRPATPLECLDLAKWCQVKKLHHTAAGLYAAAFAADSRLADDLKLAHRYNAACHAALAAAGQGDDAAMLDEKERTRLRQQALTWLRADLVLWAKLLETGQPADRVAAQRAMKHWQEDTDLAGLRDEAASAKLPEEEQKAWNQLWSEVAALVKKAEEKPN